MNKFLRDSISKLPWLYYIASYSIIKLFSIFPGFYLRGIHPVDQNSCLAIEAGEKGWDNIEFKEMYSSAIEFFGEKRVQKIVIDKSKPYVAQIKSNLRNANITHYLYDPRTGSQDYFIGGIESLRIALLFARYRVVPIVYLTDLSVRKSRCQASAVSALNGLVVTFMLPKLVKTIFPHERLIGPSLMPFSIKTLEHLKSLRLNLQQSGEIQNLIRFTGSLYEPRSSFLMKFSEGLAESEHSVEILGRVNGVRVSDNEYWSRIISSSIVITTADQCIQPGLDLRWIPHLVYRYLEVMASGSLLLAYPAPGVSRYFEPDKHFVSYKSLDEAIEKARFYLENPKELDLIRLAGHQKAETLIRTHSFWVQIDTALGLFSIEN